MSNRYVTKAALILYREDGQVSVTADEIVLPEGGKPRKTGLVDQNGEPIYRLRETVAFGFRGPVSRRGGSPRGG